MGQHLSSLDAQSLHFLLECFEFGETEEDEIVFSDRTYFLGTFAVERWWGAEAISIC